MRPAVIIVSKNATYRYHDEHTIENPKLYQL